MERVQFEQEQMLEELKEFVERKIFTPVETKQIMKKRTEFERTLVRRVAKKADYLRYIAYEIGLEKLRKKRFERLQLDTKETKKGRLSDYALVRRKFHIFERALKRFKDDVALWIEYIKEAKKDGARTLVGRITARAIQLHPTTPSLYILAASHELDHLAPSAARSLMQRGIRMNKESVDLWREYVKMELDFVEGLRRRWEVLGITEKGKAKEVDADMDAESEEEISEDARAKIMQGEIVKSVMKSAVTAIPKIELFEALYERIQAHSSPIPLKTTLLVHLDTLLREALPPLTNPRSLRILYLRLLRSEDCDEVERLKMASELLMSTVQQEVAEDILEVYAEFVLDWCRRDGVDPSLREYVEKSFLMVLRLHKKSGVMLAAHLLLLFEKQQEGLLDKAREYTDRVPTSRKVWEARGKIVKTISGESSVEAAEIKRVLLADRTWDS